MAALACSVAPACVGALRSVSAQKMGSRRAPAAAIRAAAHAKGLPACRHESSPRQRSLQSPSVAPRRRDATEEQASVVAQASKQTFSTFEDMISVADAVLVDFYATWCGPCQLMNPILADVSARAGDKFRIVKIDTEKYPVLASEYKVEALPTFIIFYKGKPVDRVEGALTADKLLARIDDAIAAASSSA